jgi:hypothetical protein
MTRQGSRQDKAADKTRQPNPNPNPDTLVNEVNLLHSEPVKKNTVIYQYAFLLKCKKKHCNLPVCFLVKILIFFFIRESR